MKRKGMNAMAKFLVPLTINLSASLGDASVNHARLNHLIRFQQPMRDSTNEPSCDPIREPTNNRMEIDKVKSNKREPIASHSSIKRDFTSEETEVPMGTPTNDAAPSGSEGASIASNSVRNSVSRVVTFQDQNASRNGNPQQQEWQMPESVDLRSSGLRRSSRLAALHSSETIEAHSTSSKTIGT